MKTAELKTAGLIVALLGATSFAYAGDGCQNCENEERGGPEGRRPPPHVIERFDADGDGELNEAEREALREEMDKRGGPEERRGGPEGRQGRKPPQHVIDKFDADGDGKLNEEERAAAKAAFEEKHGERPENGKGQKGKKGGRGNREEMLKKYDIDGDGKLSEEEREAARADRKKDKQVE